MALDEAPKGAVVVTPAAWQLVSAAYDGEETAQVWGGGY